MRIQSIFWLAHHRLLPILQNSFKDSYSNTSNSFQNQRNINCQLGHMMYNCLLLYRMWGSLHGSHLHILRLKPIAGINIPIYINYCKKNCFQSSLCSYLELLNMCSILGHRANTVDLADQELSNSKDTIGHTYYYKNIC